MPRLKAERSQQVIHIVLLERLVGYLRACQRRTWATSRQVLRCTVHQQVEQLLLGQADDVDDLLDDLARQVPPKSCVIMMSPNTALCSCAKVLDSLANSSQADIKLLNSPALGGGPFCMWLITWAKQSLLI